MKLNEIISAASQRLGITELNPMQLTMAEATARSIILIAPTGSGKTLACAIPILTRLETVTGVKALALVPSRELALQMAKVFAALAPHLRVVAFYGGHSMPDEIRSLEASTPDIVVGTPGRILDHINRRSLSVAATPTLLLDEYDKALELGFEGEMKRIMRSMRSVRSTILSSATRLTEIPEFMQLNAPEVIDFSTDRSAAPKLEVYRVASSEADKLQTLCRLLDSLPRERTMVFVNHRESAARVFAHLNSLKYPAIVYHGALEQTERETAIDLFTNGTSPILICTDLAARGLDIDGVESVIHYHLPTSPEVWTHRNGRAARMGASGSVYAICGPSESLDYDNEPYIPQPLGEPWRRTVLSLWFNAGKKEKLSRGDVAGALIRVAGLAPDSVGKISVHDHRIIAAVDATDAATAMTILNASKIKGHKVRVTMIK